MRIKFSSIVPALLVLAACTGKKGAQTTTINAVFPEEVDKISVVLPAGDTLINVEPASKQVTFTIPADITGTTSVMTSQYSVEIVSDGTVIDISENGLGLVKAVSRTPRRSVHTAYMDFTKWMADFTREYNVATTAIRMGDDPEEKKNADMEAVYNKFGEQYLSYMMETVKKNRDNIVGVFAVTNSSFDDDQMDEAISMLSPQMQENPQIVALRTDLDERLKTAEGKMFTDFEIPSDPENPEGQIVRLSDYVGKGKYVLVDFWASWCGPCKEEMPVLKDVYKRFSGESFDMLSVAVWDSETAAADTAKAYGITWNRIDNGGVEPTNVYRITGIPHTILFGPDGTILKRDLYGPAIAAEVSKYVKEQ